MQHLPTLGAGSLDESDVCARLALAVADLKTARASDRVRLRLRIGNLSAELARVLTRSGREHLATLLVADDVPSDV